MIYYHNPIHYSSLCYTTPNIDGISTSLYYNIFHPLVANSPKNRWWADPNPNPNPNPNPAFGGQQPHNEMVDRLNLSDSDISIVRTVPSSEIGVLYDTLYDIHYIIRYTL